MGCGSSAQVEIDDHEEELVELKILATGPSVWRSEVCSFMVLDKAEGAQPLDRVRTELKSAGDAVDHVRAVREREELGNDEKLSVDADAFGTEAASCPLQVLLLVNHSDMVAAQAASKRAIEAASQQQDAELAGNDGISGSGGARNGNELVEEAAKAVRSAGVVAQAAYVWRQELDVGGTVTVRHVCVRDRWGLQDAMRDVFKRVLFRVEAARREKEKERAKGTGGGRAAGGGTGTGTGTGTGGRQQESKELSHADAVGIRNRSGDAHAATGMGMGVGAERSASPPGGGPSPSSSSHRASPSLRTPSAVALGDGRIRLDDAMATGGAGPDPDVGKGRS